VPVFTQNGIQAGRMLPRLSNGTWRGRPHQLRKNLPGLIGKYNRRKRERPQCAKPRQRTGDAEQHQLRDGPYTRNTMQIEQPDVQPVLAVYAHDTFPAQAMHGNPIGQQHQQHDSDQVDEDPPGKPNIQVLVQGD